MIPAILTVGIKRYTRVIDLLQQDMRVALQDLPLSVLRAQYRDEYLFSPEESAKISDYR